MRTAYLAGPMRGLPKYNFPEFFKAAKVLRKDGWAIISPAEMDQDAKEDVSGKLGVGEIEETRRGRQAVRRIVRRDIEAILSLRAENGDAIIVLPNWIKSVGTNAELRVGKWLGLELLQLTWGPKGAILKQLEV